MPERREKEIETSETPSDAYYASQFFLTSQKDLIDNTRGERSQERPPKNEESVLKLFVINVVILSSLSRSCIRYQV